MTRTYVVTGSASGIGKATVELLVERGERVIGVDIRDADVIADLSNDEGRALLVERVAELSGGRIDAVIANAGLVAPIAATVAVNYFGAVATLEGLRPLLAASDAPRAVATVSGALLSPPDDQLLAALLEGDEPAGLERGRELEAVSENNPIYGTTKRGLARWLRQQAGSAAWAGAGIPLNAVAPGFVRTPMVADFLSDESRTAFATSLTPLGGIAEPRVLAYALAWLASAENSFLCGQILHVDGGAELTGRGDDIWS